jgi:ankyrin repeat protein
VFEAEYDHTETVKSFVKAGFDVKTYGTDLISAATKNQNIELFEFLLESGAAIDNKNSTTTPPLIAAVRSYGKEKELVTLLLKAGSDPNVLDQEGNNALAYLPWTSGNDEIAIILLEAGTSATHPSIMKAHNETLIHFSVKAKSPELYNAARKAGVSITTLDYFNHSPLTTAVIYGDPWFTRELIAAGVPVHNRDFSEKDRENVAPNIRERADDILAIAVGDGRNLEVVEILLNAGAGIETHSDKYNGGTALHAAVETVQTDMAEALIKAGAKVNAKDDFNRTPLHIAVNVKNKELITLLLNNGADVNALDKFKNTPLHVAANAKDKEVIMVLLKAGADENAKDGKGMRPVDYLMGEGDTELRLLFK